MYQAVDLWGVTEVRVGDLGDEPSERGDWGYEPGQAASRSRQAWHRKEHEVVPVSGRPGFLSSVAALQETRQVTIGHHILAG